MSIRINLEDSNMDLVMSLVREWDCKPTDVINKLLDNPKLITDARSKLYEEGCKGFVFEAHKAEKE